jgi:hypothetical protein
LEFLKASIADLVTLLFSSLQNSEGTANGDSGDSFENNVNVPSKSNKQKKLC